jgi:hypothetical protein
MDDLSYVVGGDSNVSAKLLKIFLSSAIIDNGGTLNISRRSLAELSDLCEANAGFCLLATPNEERDMELQIEWYPRES